MTQLLPLQHSREAGDQAIRGALKFSRGFSEQLSELAQDTKFHSWNDISRLEQYENHNSRSNSWSDSQIDGHNPHERCSFALALSECLFKNWGGHHAPGVVVNYDLPMLNYDLPMFNYDLPMCLLLQK